ncbi:putative phosphatase regulatory subunit-domain-containing protein, partial [Dichotomocladium elegans]
RRVTLVHCKSAPVSPTLPATKVAAVVRQKKTVHFCDTLEQVRLFLKTQKPSAVREGDPPPMPLELKFPNWPEKTVLRSNRDSMIRMESVQLENSGPDGIMLVGRCKVANLAFHKHVVVRYTTDYWKSYHEVAASFREPIGATANTWDRFTFEINVDQPCTLYIVLRYDVNDNEFWDNNGGLNYQVDV